MSDTPEPKTPQVTVLSFKKLDLRIPAGDEPAGSVITPYVRDDVIFLDKNPPPDMPRRLPFAPPPADDTPPDEPHVVTG